LEDKETEMNIVRARKIHDRRLYHAWTDLAAFKGRYFLAFRTGTMHTSGDGFVEVLQSHDTESWRHCGKGIFRYGDETSVSGLVATEDKLHLYLFVTWFDLEAGKIRHQTLVCWTRDGESWQGPFKTLPADHVMFHPILHKGRFYTTAYHDYGRGSELCTADLFASEDGVAWEKVANVGAVHPNTSETTLAFTSEDEMIALIRWEPAPGESFEANACGFLGRSRPPYTAWEYEKIDFVAGQVMTWWNGQLYAISRTFIGERERMAPWDTGDRTAVFRLRDDRLERLLLLPGGGDSSYAGVAPLPSGNLLVTYYSSLEFAADPTTRWVRSAIYLAELAP
jgi:hypothetical protein